MSFADEHLRFRVPFAQSIGDEGERVKAKIESRIKVHHEFLSQQHKTIFEDQKHLNSGSVERAYWHYGYMVALRDVLALLDGSGTLE